MLKIFIIKLFLKTTLNQITYHTVQNTTSIIKGVDIPRYGRNLTSLNYIIGGWVSV